MRRRLSIGLLVLVALLGAASLALWWWAEGLLAQGVADWRAQARADGWSVTAGPATRGGWPLAVTYSLDDVTIIGDAGTVPGGAAYTAARITLRLDPRDLSVLTVSGEGAQSLRAGATATLPFTAERLRLSVPLAQGQAATSAALDAKSIAFAGPAAGLTIGLLEGNADWSAQATAFRLSAEAITLPPPPAPQAALGPHIASATIEGTLSGTLPANPASPAAASPAAALAGWRDSGGAITLRHIALGWGPLGVTGQAAARLDAALQPDASASLRIVGSDDTLTALAAAKTITPRAARAATAVIGLMAHAPEGGGTAGVDLPLTLRDGTLSLGMIPLATVGKLDWSAGP